MKRVWMIFSLLAGLLLVLVPAALAQDSDEVAAVVAETGVYVASGSDARESEVGVYVAALRDSGENISIVVLAEEPLAGATTFAGAVSNRIGGGLVFVVAPETVGIDGVSEEFGDIEVEDAVDASLDGATDVEVVAIFSETLLGFDVTGTGSDGATATTLEPAATSSGTSSSSDSGGGSGFLIFLLLAGGGLILFFWWRSRQNKTKGPRLQPGLAEAKEAVQKQINAVANDIIDMEDEVRKADNKQVDEFYNAAGRTYNDVTEAFVAANTPQAVLDLSNELDEAIWQLDSAEAILDGKQPPSRPQPKRLPTPEPAAAPQGASRPDESSLPPRPSYDQPKYDRRPSRRSSYSGGSSIVDLLIGVAGAMMAGRSRGRGGLLGGRSSSTSSARARRVPPQQFPQLPSSRSGGGPIVPSPSQPGRSSSSSRSSRSSRSTRTRRGKTGRVRTGGRRRRG